MLYIIATKILLVYYKLVHRIEIKGIENIPKEGRAVLCANHQSIQDPLVLASMVKRPISFLAKAELFRSKILGFIFRAVYAIPVERGKMDMKAFREATKTLKEDKLLGIFIQGTRVKAGEEDDGAKGGAVLFAQRTDAPIIPIGIVTSYRPFSKITINVGKEISMEQYKGEKMNSEKLTDIADGVLDDIRKLCIKPIKTK